jgi:hypothetical protein
VRYGVSWKRTTHYFRKLCWRRYNCTSKRFATWLINHSKGSLFDAMLKLEISSVFQLHVVIFCVLNVSF